MPTPPRNISDLNHVQQNKEQNLQIENQLPTSTSSIASAAASSHQLITERDRVLKTNSLAKSEQYKRLMLGTVKPLHEIDTILREQKRRRKNKIARITPTDMKNFWTTHHQQLHHKSQLNETQLLPDHNITITPNYRNNNSNSNKSIIDKINNVTTTITSRKSIKTPSSVVKSIKIDKTPKLSNISDRNNSFNRIYNNSRLLSSISNSELLNYPNATLSTPILFDGNSVRHKSAKIAIDYQSIAVTVLPKNINKVQTLIEITTTTTPYPVFNVKRASRTDRSIHTQQQQQHYYQKQQHNTDGSSSTIDERKNRRKKSSPLDRNERSANLSHITGVTRKIQLYIKNRYLQLLPDGTVNGTQDEFSDFSKFFFW